MEDNNKSPLEKYQEYWDIIDYALSEGTSSGYKIAIIETEKILAIAMDDKKIPGKNVAQKVKNAEVIFENPEKLNYARSIYEKLIKECGFAISADETREIVSGYYKAIFDIVKMKSKKLPFKEKINFFLQRHFNQFPQKAKKAIVFMLLFFFAIFLSTETSTGNSIFQAIITFSQFLFYTVFTMLLKILTAVIIIIGILYYWKNRKG